MAGLTVLLCLVAVATLPLLALYCIFRALRSCREHTDPTERGRRAAIVLLGAAIVSSPYIAYRIFDLAFTLSRVPAPLHAIWIDYRSDKSCGIGLPGDNETGFIAYRLTGSSAAWAKSHARDLDALLPGDRGDWHRTPATQGANRRPNDSDALRTELLAQGLTAYLGRYGYDIPTDPKAAARFDFAVRHPGSFYSFGRGGSVTVVDPLQGRVYFAYAG